MVRVCLNPIQNPHSVPAVSPKLISVQLHPRREGIDIDICYW